MVNGINVPGGISLKEAEVPDEVLTTQDASAIEQAMPAREYKSKYQLSIKNWYRRNVGTYPKWLANITRRIVRFAFRHVLHRKIEILFRGRGARPIGCRQDLPIHYAKKVAIYVTLYRRNKNA